MSNTASNKCSDAEIPPKIWKSVVLITTQSFLFGYCFSSLNSCLVTGDNNSGSDCYNHTDSTCPPGTMYNDLNLSTLEAQLATALIVLGAWIGCMLGSKPSEMKGRKFTLLLNNIFFIFGAALTCSGNLYLLFIGRFVSGLGVGVSSVVPPVLLSEIADSNSRGIITTCHQLMVTFAIFIVSIVSYGFVTYVSHGWQYVQALAAVPSVMQILLRAYIPESPKWLVAQYATKGGYENHQAGGYISSPLIQGDNIPAEDPGMRKISALDNEDYKKAAIALKMVRHDGHDVDAEIDALMQDIKADADKDPNVSWSEVFANKRAVLIGCGLMFFQALTGINSVIFYSTTIFGLAGFDQSIIGTTLVGLVNFGMTVVAIRLIDNFGRRYLLLRGTYAMLFSLVLLSAILLASVPAKAQGDVAVVAVLIYVSGFAVGMGAVVWAIMSEVMSTRLRAKAMSLFLSINWGCNFVIGLSTLTAIDSLGGVKGGMDDDETNEAKKKGVAYLYLIFAIIAAGSLVFIHMIVPETKGLSPEHFSERLLS